MDRPDPDELLDKLQRDEARQQRGRLKIFFGASAGVGKTFAMLQGARRRLAEESLDVAVGVVETHGRSETAALLEGMEVLPPLQIEYRGRMLAEFDLDAALARKPQLLLVDELAHSNLTGARHLKRWQDVQELLAAGIDVYTTVNVQHLESLNDVVGQITGIRVWETVPDHVFDMADEVTLVDLPAEELLDRLRDGKVYLAQQAERAVRNFFRKGNLIALRELALRRTADRVDAQMREYRADQSIQRIWQARERLLVCVGPGDGAESLVRSAARLAANLKADWIAVYVETAALQRRSDAQREPTFAALKLAQELGAEAVTLDGSDAVPTLLSYARVRNVSKLVVGASRRQGLSRGLKRSLGDRLIEHAGEIDVTLVHIQVQASAGAPQRQSFADDIRNALAGEGEERSPASSYGWAALSVALITGVSSFLTGHLDLTNLVMLYLLGVIFAAARLGRGPGALASVLSVAAFDFFFVPPRMSFSVSDTQYVLTFAGMLVTSLVISHLTATLRQQARIASYRERRTGAMYAMARELAAALTTEQIIEIGSRHVSEVFRAKVAILLPDSADQVRQPVEELLQPIWLTGPQLDVDVAQWVYDQQKPAGVGTDTLPASAAKYLPLKAPMRTRGVLALTSESAQSFAGPEQAQMLDTFAAQIALAVERVHYVDIARDAVVSMESERLRNSLLSAISHDLRTPLTTIVGFSSMLAQSQGIESGQNGLAMSNSDLVEAIHEEALRMTGLVTNLLDMARLQAGGVQLSRQWLMLEEVVGAALRASRRRLAQHPVHVHLPSDLPLLQLDAVLMERLFTNLFENAAKYAGANSSLDISANTMTVDGKSFVRVNVDDHGPGLPSGMEKRIFEKFTRGEKESAKPGIGLGLAICRAIVNAHGGEIGAENRLMSGGTTGTVVHGARFWFTLPAGEAPPGPETLADESGGESDGENGHKSGRAMSPGRTQGHGQGHGESSDRAHTGNPTDGDPTTEEHSA